MSLANVSIVGNLVKDPEQFSFKSGRTKTAMTVAVNRTSKEGDKADFYKVEAWNKLAESVAQYLHKGDQVTILGRLLLERWTDKEGNERTTPTVVADNIAFPRRLKVVPKVRDEDLDREVKVVSAAELDEGLAPAELDDPYPDPPCDDDAERASPADERNRA